MDTENNRNKSATTGLTFTGLLQVAFIVLKLCGVIKWSWFWVLAPLWIDAAVLIICIIVMILIVRGF